MKILYIIRSLDNSGGTERVLSSRLNELSKDVNFELSILTYSSHETTFFEFSDKIKFITLEKKTKQRLLQELYFQRILFKIISEYDIIVSLGGLDMYSLPFFKNKWNKLVIECHFPYDIRVLSGKYENNGNYSRISTNIRKKIDRYIYSLFDVFVVLTKKDKELWGLDNIVTINNFVLQSSLKSDLSQKVAICTGRLSKEKGFADLLRIWSKSIAKEKGWILQIFGSGIEKNNLMSEIDELDIGNSVILNSPTHDVMSKYASSSIFLSTSYYEGFGLSLLEAMSCGLPVITFNCPNGPSEFVKNEENGYLIPNRDIDGYIKKLNMICDDDLLLKNMGDISYQTAKSFSLERIIKEWKSLFIKIYDQENTY